MADPTDPGSELPLPEVAQIDFADLGVEHVAFDLLDGVACKGSRDVITFQDWKLSSS